MTTPPSTSNHGNQINVGGNIENSTITQTYGSAPTPPASGLSASVAPTSLLKVNLFLSYRRNASKNFTGRLYDQLKQKLDPSSVVFWDNVGLGAGDFPSQLLEAIERTDIFIIIISPNTFDPKRIHSNNDWVRGEIAYAIRLGKPILQVAEDQTDFADRYDLPDDLLPLKTMHGVRLNTDEFEQSVTKLIEVLRQTVRP